MSGHSKWATIKHKKAVTDARRGKMFTRLIKEITIAARDGGGDPDANPRLRAAMVAAKAENMPADNIKRAVQRGTGELPGVNYEEVAFEAYGPHGVALIVEVTTDNRNRTVSEIRHLFSKHGGSLGEAGCVAWMFNKLGTVVIPKQSATEDQLLDIVLDHGAEDIRDSDEQWEVICSPETTEALTQAIRDAGIEVTSSEVGRVPQNYVKLDGAKAQQMIKLLDALEEHDDVQHVYSNFDFDAAELEQVSEA